MQHPYLKGFFKSKITLIIEITKIPRILWEAKGCRLFSIYMSSPNKILISSIENENCYFSVVNKITEYKQIHIQQMFTAS